MKKLTASSLIVFAVLIITATFFDLQIDSLFYNPESGFAKFFATAGMLPQIAVQFLSPAMLLAVLFEKRRSMKRAAAVSILAVILLASVVSMYDAVRYIAGETGVPIVILSGAVCFFVFLLFLAALPLAKKRPEGLLITALTGLIAVCAGNVVLQFLKTFWGRQRFFTMDNPAGQFTKWYLPQGRAVSNNFKSFPSGHSFAAMCTVWFALWPLFIDGLKKYTRLIFAAALLFSFTVMASRIIYGRHFLSDVTFGAAISLASFALTYSLVRRYFSRRGNLTR